MSCKNPSISPYWIQWKAAAILVIQTENQKCDDKTKHQLKSYKKKSDKRGKKSNFESQKAEHQIIIS